MGVMTTSSLAANGGWGMSSSWFTDNDGSGERLGAAVFWRGRVGGLKAHHPRFPTLHALIGILLVNTRILPLLWPRAFHAWMHGSFRAADEWEAQIRPPEPYDGDTWTSSSGSGDDRVRYDRNRGVVGVRSRVFGPPPPGHALLLLVDEDASAPDGLRVIETAVVMPATPGRPPLDSAFSKQERAKLISSYLREKQEVWSAALSANPEYQRFMGGET
jgi:hypothetical protein